MSLSPLHKLTANETSVTSCVSLAKTQHGVSVFPGALTTCRTGNPSAGFRSPDEQQVKFCTQCRCATNMFNTSHAEIRYLEINTEQQLDAGFKFPAFGWHLGYPDHGWYIPGLPEVLVINPGFHPRPQTASNHQHDTGHLIPACFPAIALSASENPEYFSASEILCGQIFSASEISGQITRCVEHCFLSLGAW